MFVQVTKGILDRLKAGVAPWEKPWKAGERPRNLATNRPYHGVNALSLGQDERASQWCTYKQAQSCGWQIRAGAKGVPILYAGERVVDVPVGQRGLDGEATRIVPVFRVFHVFNAVDIDGVPESRLGVSRVAWDPIEKAEEILRGLRPVPTIQHLVAQAYYSRTLDHINMPGRASFSRSHDYYAVLFHELTHWTGHESRLNRPTLCAATRFGDSNYSQEELVAEIGAGFLGAEARLPEATLDRSAAYIDNWLSVLKAEPQMVVRAASHAEAAATLILGGLEPPSHMGAFTRPSQSHE